MASTLPASKLSMIISSICKAVFEPPPPLPLTYKPFHFLTCVRLESVGLRPVDVPFHSGWALVEYKPLVIEDAGYILEVEDELDEEDVFVRTEQTMEVDESFMEKLFGETERTEDEAVHELTMRELETESVPEGMEVTGAEPVKEMDRTGTVPVLEEVMGDIHNEHLPGTNKECQETPSPSPAIPVLETVMGSVPRRPRNKSVARKRGMSMRQDAQGTRSSAPRVVTQVAEEVGSSSEETSSEPLRRRVRSQRLFAPENPQASSEPRTQQTPTPQAAPKRKPEEPSASSSQPPVPSPKRAKTVTMTSPLLEKFLKRGVVRGKIVRKEYFRAQGLGVFLKALRSQGWLELFTNTQLGCSQPDVAEFYANVHYSEGVLTSTVKGVVIQVNATALGVILGIPATGFSSYIREDKRLISQGQLLEVARRLGRQPGLRSPQSVKKGDMDSFHQLLFWFVIKNIIPRGQGRSQADSMDQYLIDLMDREIQINLPALMIRHIMRIATTPRAHDLGYGFLLTKVFEHFGVELTNRVAAQAGDEVGNSTLRGCGFVIRRPGELSPEQDSETPDLAPAIPVPDHSQPSASTPTSSQSNLPEEITALKRALEEEKELSAKRHADLLSLLAPLLPKSPAP